jgi:8-oxo-dGTP pyrophosphatase MutT (NUDIX family)/predicted transcriptional regulator
MLEPKVMHHIQRDILRSLLSAPNLRFKDIKPAGLESNIFMYHLKTLIKEDLVEKTDGGYTLTSKGKHFVDRANLESLKVRIQPKTITILAIENTDGKLVILERLHQPFINHKGFPSGKIHYGESLLQAAERELLEKTGFTGIPLTFRGNFIMRYDKDGATVNHIIGYVFSGTVTDNPPLDFRNEYFRSYWGTKEELYADNRFKGHPELFELLNKTPKNELFVAEHDFTSDF